MIYKHTHRFIFFRGDDLQIPESISEAEDHGYWSFGCFGLDGHHYLQTKEKTTGASDSQLWSLAPPTPST